MSRNVIASAVWTPRPLLCTPMPSKMTTSMFCAALVETLLPAEDATENGVSVDIYDDGLWRMYEPLPGFIFVEIASGRVEMKDGMVVLP